MVFIPGIEQVYMHTSTASENFLPIIVKEKFHPPTVIMGKY